MLQNIPTHVIAGPLGAGKTSLISHLLAQRPAGERWAVLINEFGQIGIDAALLTRDADGIALGEVAGGCLCCVNGAPFQISRPGWGIRRSCSGSCVKRRGKVS
jgi:G3E family GTPase